MKIAVMFVLSAVFAAVLSAPQLADNFGNRHLKISSEFGSTKALKPLYRHTRELNDDYDDWTPREREINDEGYYEGILRSIEVLEAEIYETDEPITENQ